MTKLPETAGGAVTPHPTLHSEPAHRGNELVQWIRHGEDVEALIVRSAYTASQTTFLTEGRTEFQLGLIVYPAGGAVVPHVHLPVVRHIDQTLEVLVVRKGAAEVDFYDRDRRLVATHALGVGDTLLLIRGGHGLRFSSDTELLEVKQGPFVEGTDKLRFTP